MSGPFVADLAAASGKQRPPSLSFRIARKRRQLVLIGPEAKGSSAPLGSLREVRERLAAFNTAGDGGPSKGATEFLYAPGFTVELASGIDPVTQAIASVSDEDIAWPVLTRICKELGWRMMDLESGRIFG